MRYLLFLLTALNVLHADPYAFVANSTDGTVTPINLTTNVPEAPIFLGGSPAFVAITPDNSKALVTNVGTSSVTIIDTASRTILSTLPFLGAGGGAPRGIAITADSLRAYITEFAPSGAVYRLTISTGVFTGPIAVGTFPEGIAITGTKAYVTSFFSTDVTPIDLTTDTPGTPIPVASDSTGIAITPSGATAYVSLTDGTVVPIDVSSDTPGTPITVGNDPRGIAITPNGLTAYVANSSDNTVTPITILTNTPGPTIAVGTTPYSIAINAASTKAYVTNFGSTTVTPITLPANTPDPTIAVGAGPFGIAAMTASAPLAPPPPAPGPAPAPTPATPLPPTNLHGEQKNNRFAFVSELFNKLSWDPSPSPNVTSYKIYRDGTLLNTVTDLQFEDHNRKKKQTHLYAVTALASDGRESPQVTLLLP